MIHDPELLDKLQAVAPIRWKGRVYRYMFGEIDPGRANTRGARWNPPGVGAIYTALDRDTVRAELEYRLSFDVVRPRLEAQLYGIDVSLFSVLNLSSFGQLQALGLTKEECNDVDYRACQKVGGAVAWLEHDGLLVPSARSGGTNLVIFQASQHPDAEFEVREVERLKLRSRQGPAPPRSGASGLRALGSDAAPVEPCPMPGEM